MWLVLLVAVWCFVLLEGLLLLGILRQIGVLHQKIDGLGMAGIQPPSPRGIPLGARSPAFTLPRVGGGEVSLSDFRGTRILLAFIQPGCGPCKNLLPHLNALALNTEETRAQVVLVSAGEREVNERLHEEYEIVPPIGLQRGGEVSQSYNVTGTPFVYVIDESGLIRASGVANTREQLEQMLTSVEKGETDGQTDRKTVPLHRSRSIA